MRILFLKYALNAHITVLLATMELHANHVMLDFLEL